MSTKLVTAHEMRSIEKEMVARGTGLNVLMERAGRAAGELAARLAGGGQVLILAGPGNNGGDGIVAARYLLERGHPVAVYTFHRADTDGFRGVVLAAEEDGDQVWLMGLLQTSAVIVDALLGIGQSRPPEGVLAGILRTMNGRGARATRVAVDIPTGVDADSGAVQGEAFRADVTLCMGFAKRGVALHPGAAYAGRIEVATIGMPDELAHDVQVSVPGDEDIVQRLPTRPAESNKGTYGRLVVVGGSRDYLGAPALCALGAYRVGAGLVELAVPTSVQESVAAHLLEAIFSPLPEEDGRISGKALPVISHLLERASACVFGPGMGLSPVTQELTRAVLLELGHATIRGGVVDADALNALAKQPEWWSVDAPLVLTPHPGEMSRLTGREIKEIQADRLGCATQCARMWGKVVVLKGSGTVVASPGGEAVINPTGGPNLATAGSGDVLSGIIGGLMAQGCSPYDAAVAGVYLHGRSGDMLLREHGDAGTIASDLAAVLPRARQSVLRESEENS